MTRRTPIPGRRECLLTLAALPWLALAGEGDAAAWNAARARQALALLAQAPQHGLVADDYGVAALAAQLAGLPPAGGPLPAELAGAFDTAMRHYLHDLAFGRIDPHSVHHRFSVAPRAGFDPAQVLAAALAADRLGAAVQSAMPALPQYPQLQRVLADMRALAGHAAWAQPLPPLPRPVRGRKPRVDPGDAWDGLPLMAQRLSLLGDLAPGAWSGPLFDGPLVAALQGFQLRHGLTDDGVIGASTLAALQVSPEARARQVALNLERLRWTPLLLGPRMVVVNIPEYTLRAYEVVDGRIQVRLSMRVIVGQAMDHETPLFDERMRSIEFSPFWNVPPSIARKETLPRLRRDPAYWDRQGFEFVAGDGSVVTTLSAQALDAVQAGQLRIRQRPGPANALGDIKFVFPNRDAIYLHHTPSVGLFARERRDFSHGCIRVEDPVALARFVMAGMPGWDEARIRAQMAAGQSTHVALLEPVPVLIAYGTSLVREGRPFFLPDVYGHDARLQAALDARPRTSPHPPPAR